LKEDAEKERFKASETAPKPKKKGESGRDGDGRSAFVSRDELKRNPPKNIVR
jgi:hypothetical protein